MPKGVWKDSEKQMQHIRGLHKRPRTQKQIEAFHQNLKKAREVACKLPRTEKQIEAGRKLGQVGANQKGKPKNYIVRHHNDLCHGKKDPNNVTYMSHSEHCRLHTTLRNKLKIENGTHNFLARNRRKKL